MRSFSMILAKKLLLFFWVKLNGLIWFCSNSQDLNKKPFCSVLPIILRTVANLNLFYSHLCVLVKVHPRKKVFFFFFMIKLFFLNLPWRPLNVSFDQQKQQHGRKKSSSAKKILSPFLFSGHWQLRECWSKKVFSKVGMLRPFSVLK